MKKIFTFALALCLAGIGLQAANYFYLCGITELTVDTLQSTTKHQFTLNWTQKCKNIGEYTTKPETFYTTTVKLVLNSDDNTLEGVYTTEGASETSSSANVNDQTINLVTSELYYGSTRRLLRTDSISTLTIIKVDETHYGISAGRLCFTAAAMADRNKHTYNYNLCYNAEEILTQGIEPEPYVFYYSKEYVELFYSYDLTVTGLNIEYSKTDYGNHRYFLTMQCSGIQRETGNERNYEVKLAIYPDEENIADSYSTQTGNVLYSDNSYVKDLQISKQRNLAHDSISSVAIVSTGENQYNFTGGPLVCTDVDQNYQAVTGNKRIEATHYYYFNSNNGGNGIDFSFDGENASLTPPDATGIGQAESRTNARKISRDGVVYIERNGALYNLQGALIR